MMLIKKKKILLLAGAIAVVIGIAVGIILHVSHLKSVEKWRMQMDENLQNAGTALDAVYTDGHYDYLADKVSASDFERIDELLNVTAVHMKTGAYITQEQEQWYQGIVTEADTAKALFTITEAYKALFFKGTDGAPEAVAVQAENSEEAYVLAPGDKTAENIRFIKEKLAEIQGEKFLFYEDYTNKLNAVENECTFMQELTNTVDACFAGETVAGTVTREQYTALLEQVSSLANKELQAELLKKLESIDAHLTIMEQNAQAAASSGSSSSSGKGASSGGSGKSSSGGSSGGGSANNNNSGNGSSGGGSSPNRSTEGVITGGGTTGSPDINGKSDTWIGGTFDPNAIMN